MYPAKFFRIHRHLTLAIASVALIVVLVLIMGASVARAKNGRDFAAHYQIQNVTNLGTSVRVTLALRMVNFSGADVSSATVTVRDPLFMQRILGTFSPSPVSVAKGRSVLLTGQITIPQREYDVWQTGTPPTVVLTYQGSNQGSKGTNAGSRVEMVQRPLSEVQ